MSKEFAQSFFPSLTSFVSSPDLAPSFLVDAWNAIFPDNVTTICRLPPTHTFIPQRPCLAIAAMIGAFIGLHLGSDRRMLHREDGAHGILAVSIHDTWSKSLITFGSMNVVALIHHCIIPPPTSYQNYHSARKHVDNILWGADCIFTGLSSINLTIMAWLLYNSYTEKNNSKEVKSMKRSIMRLRISVHISLFAIAATLPMLLQLFRNGHIDFWAAASTSIEMVYLLPVGVAASFLFPLAIASAFNVLGMCNKRSITGARVAILGGTLVLASLPLDAPLCNFVSKQASSIKISPLLNDVYHLPTLLFMGCDVAFLGLNMWVNDLIHELSAQNKKNL